MTCVMRQRSKPVRDTEVLPKTAMHGHMHVCAGWDGVLQVQRRNGCLCVCVCVCKQRAESYRLDIELGRMEFLVHPAMAQEDLLVSVYVCMCVCVCVCPRYTCAHSASHMHRKRYKHLLTSKHAHCNP